MKYAWHKNVYKLWGICFGSRQKTHSIRNNNPMFDQQPLTLFNCPSQYILCLYDLQLKQIYLPKDIPPFECLFLHLMARSCLGCRRKCREQKKPHNRFYLREGFLGHRWPTFQPLSSLFVSFLLDMCWVHKVRNPESSRVAAKLALNLHYHRIQVDKYTKSHFWGWQTELTKQNFIMT